MQHKTPKIEPNGFFRADPNLLVIIASPLRAATA
jgi:hypothetical protein